MRRPFACLALALAMALPAAAQDAAPSGPATLVADTVRLEAGGDRLVAEGSVEILSGGRILRASRVTYLREGDRLIVEGPLTLVEGPDTLLIADTAELNPEFRDSVLAGARLVLDQKLQVAAEEVSRGPEGRFTQLYGVVASSCTICMEEEVPLWRIRADRVVYDEQERQLYFEGARFDVAGVPVAWWPLVRLPGPTVERYRGWLVPRFVTDDLLGTGVAIPYFVPLGPSRDLTFTPFVTNRDALSLGIRYRQAATDGTLEFEGAIGRDDLEGDGLRGYLFGEGRFDLSGGWRFELDVEAVSDDTYLLDYDITEDDRLESRAAVARTDRTARTTVEAIRFRSLREEDDNDLLPTRILNVAHERRFAPAGIGGQAGLTFGGQIRIRPANAPPAGAPPESARDVARLSASLDWRRTWIADAGVVVTGLAELHLDAYEVGQDPRFEGVETRAVPYAGLELRYPLSRTGATGTRHLLEPVLQVVLAPDERDAVPQEDSDAPELDGANLFDTGRFAGRDARELGDRATLGLSYSTHPADPDGWAFGGTVGRIWRARDLGQFSAGSGLDGTTSDWLLAAHAQLGARLNLQSRSLVDDEFDVNRSDTIIRWQGERGAFETRYTWLEPDVTEGRPRNTSEWALDLQHDLGGDWTGRMNWRYDFVENNASRAGLGLTYRGDCVTVGLDVTRRFTSSEDLAPTTRFGLAVELAGFGAEDRRTRRRACGI
jgi:LPS-assembly protein